jgi:hypothetical protein
VLAAEQHVAAASQAGPRVLARPKTRAMLALPLRRP